MMPESFKNKIVVAQNPGITAFLLVLILTAVYFLSYSNYDMNYWDEGIPLSGVMRMMDGERPIRDFIAYPPGRYLLFLLSMNLGGVDVQTPRVLMALLSAISAGIIWQISIRAGLGWFAVFPVLSLLLTPMYYYYRFFSFMLLLLVFSIDLQLRQRNLRESFLAGIMGATIVWFRLFLGLFVLILFPIFAFIGYRRNRKKKLIPAALPLVMVGIGYLLQFYYVGGWTVWLKYLKICRSFSLAGLSGMSLPWPPLWSMNYLKATSIDQIFQDVLIYLGGSVLLVAGIYTLKRFRTMNPTVLALTITGWIGYGLVIWRPGYGNYLRSFPPIAILAVWLIGKIRKFQWSVVCIALSIFIGLAIDSLIINSATYQSIGIMRLCNSRLTHPRFSIRSSSNDCEVISGVTALLEAIDRSKRNSLLVLPFHTIFNFMSNYPCTSYYDWLLPGNFTDSEIYADMFSNVLQSEPDIILLNDEGFDSQPDRRFSRQYPELRLWIMRDYYEWAKIHGFQIFKKKPVMKNSLIKKELLEAAVIEGVCEIQSVKFGSDELKMLSMKGDCKYSTRVNRVNRPLFSSVVTVDFSELQESAQCEIQICINNIPITTKVVCTDDYCFDISLPFTQFQGESFQIQLVTQWTPDFTVGKLSWVEPVIFESDAEIMIVDSWCSTL
ncbi:hypothetical protein K8T06_05460 [bacterium]|nr:hypothetical protein [bacterium]